MEGKALKRLFREFPELWACETRWHAIITYIRVVRNENEIVQILKKFKKDLDKKKPGTMWIRTTSRNTDAQCLFKATEFHCNETNVAIMCNFSVVDLMIISQESFDYLILVFPKEKGSPEFEQAVKKLFNY